MSEITITPTVTPAPKPEWPELIRSIIRYPDGSVDTASVGKDDFELFGMTLLATVTIPSSAECERRAKVEEAREKREDILNRCVAFLEGVAGYNGNALEDLVKAHNELRAIEQENQP